MTENKSVIAFSDFPSMPAPWSSIDDGQVYEWGDYYLTLQRFPMLIIDVMQEISAKKGTTCTRHDKYPIRYPYALSVFYKPGKNPSGIDSGRPCMVLTIEQIRVDINSEQWEKPVFCLFTPVAHYNCSNFDLPLTIENAKKAFFDHLKSSISGTPRFLGDFKALKNIRKAKDNSPKGCILLVLWAISGCVYLYEPLDGQWKYHIYAEIVFYIASGIIGIWLLQKITKLIYGIIYRSCKQICSFKITILKQLSDFQKIFLGLAVVSILVLTVALCDKFDTGYYTFLRIIVSASLAGLLIEKFPVWCKLIFILAIILYNPIVQIHLDNREAWAFFNTITIPLLVFPWGVILKRTRSLPIQCEEKKP